MCQRCVELQLAINNGRRLAKSEGSAEARNNAKAFVETLRVELASLQAQPDHQS